MGFPSLEFLKGTQVGIAIVKVGDQAHVNFMIFGVVEKGAATGA